MKKICIVFDKIDVDKNVKEHVMLHEKIELLEKLGYEVDLFPLMGEDTTNKGLFSKKETMEHYDFDVMKEFMALVESGSYIMAQASTTCVDNFLFRFGIVTIDMEDIIKSTPIKELLEKNVTMAEYEKYTNPLPFILKDLIYDHCDYIDAQRGHFTKVYMKEPSKEDTAEPEADTEDTEEHSKED